MTGRMIPWRAFTSPPPSRRGAPERPPRSPSGRCPRCRRSPRRPRGAPPPRPGCGTTSRSSPRRRPCAGGSKELRPGPGRSPSGATPWRRSWRPRHASWSKRFPCGARPARPERPRGPAARGSARRTRRRRGRASPIRRRCTWRPPSAVPPDLHDGPLRAGHGAPHQQQVLVRAHVHDLEASLGHAAGAHLAGALDALEHASGVGGGADRARPAHVVRAMRDGPAREVVALDRAGEALALRDAGHLHALAGLEDRVDLDLGAHLELALAAERVRPTAKLTQVAQVAHAGLLEEAAVRHVEPLLARLAEAELDGVVAVALTPPDAGDEA